MYAMPEASDAGASGKALGLCDSMPPEFFRTPFPRLSVETMSFQSRNDFPFIKTQVWRSGRLNTASARTSALPVIGGGITRLGRVLFLLVICGRRCPLRLVFIANASEHSMFVDCADRTPKIRGSSLQDSTQLCW